MRHAEVTIHSIKLQTPGKEVAVESACSFTIDKVVTVALVEKSLWKSTCFVHGVETTPGSYFPISIQISVSVFCLSSTLTTIWQQPGVLCPMVAWQQPVVPDYKGGCCPQLSLLLSTQCVGVMFTNLQTIVLIKTYCDATEEYRSIENGQGFHFRKDRCVVTLLGTCRSAKMMVSG